MMLLNSPATFKKSVTFEAVRSALPYLRNGLILLCLAVSVAFGDDHAGIYSSAALGSDGRVNAWGVTNVTAMQHTASVRTTLRSPHGRTVSANGAWMGPGHSRADVYLAFDQSDLGTYTVNSVHDAYCSVMGHFINAVGTSFLPIVGTSSVCYAFPDSQVSDSAGYCYYSLKTPCNVQCNSARVAVNEFKPGVVCPQVYVCYKVCIYAGGLVYCVPLPPILGPPCLPTDASCTCSQIPSSPTPG
jgi:hypothetical protein